MNKKKKAVLKKYRKKEERLKAGPKAAPPRESWVYATGRIKKEELDVLKSDLKSSELGKLSSVSTEKLDPGYIRVQLKTKVEAAFLLRHSLAEGILKLWGERIKFHQILIEDY